ncbi:nitrate- and nitrite sensing domain-containing protein [Nonomuraea africana]|uniref:histidine kinase n=1 Tax=Nonomuraea africana TaxID=46171 RepID=A0ABR9KWE3_9ACTN|nr:nitrate- and nitrite sensing domain-containing protein [Nonomuraea africana]MBE1566347.1 signal transduction histidine kinase [Nonomuraea africana]
MRSRLTALILVPTIAGVVLGGARVVEAVGSIGEYERTVVVAEQATHLRDLIQSLGMERDTGGWFYATKQRRQLKKPYEDSKDAVDKQVKVVSAELAAMDAGYGPRVEQAAKLAAAQLKSLSGIRAQQRVRPDSTAYRYLVEQLVRVHEELSLLNNDPQILGDFRALTVLVKAKEEISRQRIMLLESYYGTSKVDAQRVTDFIAAGAQQWQLLNSFAADAGTVRSTQLMIGLKNNSDVIRAELSKARAIRLTNDGPAFQARNLLADPNEWFEDNAKAIAVLEKAESNTEPGKTGLAQAVTTRAQDLQSAELRTALLVGAAIVGLLLLVLTFTVLIARSMVSPLRRLRSEALEIAGFRLPDVVRNLRVSGNATVPEIEPIDVEGKDEIGEVAQAFDEVHRQAVRLAAEESELRSNISAMFVNLSRRTQTLVERQISLIDGLEKGEQDGSRLADLFSLDHLATRMRRNSENLLVLAGHEPTRRRSQPAKLVDVVRAALSEVEDYDRVQVKVHRATAVIGSAANDLVHLVAELVENAIQFSPKNSNVIVSSSIIEGGGALLSVSDQGISMTDEELAEANRRLAEPPVVDVSVSRRMGLFVVGRLALRHGIRVQLRNGEGSGLIAMVLLPPPLLPDANQPPPPQRPAFGGSGSPAPAFGAPAQNGAFAAFDSFDSSGWGNQQPRQGLGAFTADTGGDSGFFRQPPQQGGPHPSFPSIDLSAMPNLDQTAPHPGGSHPSFPSLEQPGPHPSFPSSDNGLPRRGPRAGDTGAFGTRPRADTTGAFGAPARPDGTGAFGTPARGEGVFGPPSRGGDTGAFPTPPPRAGDTGAFPTPPPMSAPSYPSVERFPSWETSTSSMPVVDSSPMEQEQEEFLPIFAAVESAWFRRPDESVEPPAASPQARREPKYHMPEAQAPAQAVPSESDLWRTPADAGWQAAAAASDPSLGGITAAGLPKRTPKANLVPGTAGQAPQQMSPMPPVSADRIRNRMSSFQQGVRRGRAELNDESAPNGLDKEDKA